MSDLQVLLAAVGGLVVAGFVAHGAWTSRKARPQTLQGTAPLGGRQEPQLEPGQGTGPEGGPTDSEFAGLPQPDLPTVVRKAWSGIDPLIDAVAVVELDEPVSGDFLIAHLPPTRRIGSKPMLVEARSSADEAFAAPMPGGRYTQVQAAIQLVNRQGPLNEIEFSEFVAKTNALADALAQQPGAAAVDLPDMLDVVARARELDAFASQHDAQLALELRALGSAWSPGYVQQQAAKLGFVPGAFAGRLVLPSPEPGAPGVVMLTFDPQAALADDPNQAALRRLTLALDVPQHPADLGAGHGSPFDALRASVAGLCASLNAAAMDEQGNVVSATALDGIAQGLAQLYAALAERDLDAGSPSARRLFS
jgi:hypothetical protein